MITSNDANIKIAMNYEVNWNKIPTYLKLTSTFLQFNFMKKISIIQEAY